MNLREAREAKNAAQRALAKVGKTELGATLTGIFESDPSIQHIAWGQKTSEYDDEGMYPGIMGPVINSEMAILADDGSLIETDLNQWWSALYDGTSEAVYATQHKLLSETLNLIGAELLCDIVGDDEHVVVAERTTDGFKLWSEHSGY